MDGENNGKPYEQMDDLVGFPIIFGSTPIYTKAYPFQGPFKVETASLPGPYLHWT